MKLSKTQEEVVRLMREGWILESSREFGKHVMRYQLIDPNVTGSMGFRETKMVTKATFLILNKLGLFKMKEQSLLSSTYGLKESPE